MQTLIGAVRGRLLGIRPEETKFAHRGFRGATEEMQFRLEQIGAAFRDGYHAALKYGDCKTVAIHLPPTGHELQGFAYEGAAMGLALLDCFTFWQPNRIRDFLRGAGAAHAYMVHVGAGWVWARLPWGFRRRKARLDPLLGWLAFDGWGFHDGFFRWPAALSRQPWPRQLSGYERRAFDQGLGRSLWFANGGNIRLITETIRSFPASRHADLWSGIGLAATYAGIVSADELQQLCAAAGKFRASLAQGAAFAAKARLRAGNVSDYTELAASVFCGTSVRRAAEVTDRSLQGLPSDSDLPEYEVWRLRVQKEFCHSDQLMEV